MSIHTLKFSAQNLVYEFSITGPHPVITLEKIVVNSLLGLKPTEMGSSMNKLSPMLAVSFYKPNEFIKEAPISLDAHISSYHAQPVIELKKTYPSNENVHSSPISDFHFCKIELTYNSESGIKPDTTVFSNVSDMNPRTP